jgi:hypothetical protein
MSDPRDQLEIEALVTDRYLESLLAVRERQEQPPATNDALDPAVRAAARALEDGLPRVHPSFRFEERLATDLQVGAVRQRRGGRAARPSGIRRLEPRPSGASRAPVSTSPSPTGPVSRPLLIGGALTSAAISIAGAYVAWRRGRPPLDPMVRAVRAAHRNGIGRRIPARGQRPAQRGSRNG